MGYIELMRRAGHLAETVDADRVTWDGAYKDAVLNYIGDSSGRADRQLGAPPHLPAALLKMMDGVGLSPAAAWRKSEAGVRDAARVCSQCHLAETCLTALPEPLTTCPNHDRLNRIRELSIGDRVVAAPAGCPLP